MATKTKTAARKRTTKSAGAVRAAAPKETAEVHIHPRIVEVRYNGEAGPSERLPNGAQGSDAYDNAARRVHALTTTHAVSIRHFNAQGVEIE